jgi:hypothetical protein
MFSKGVELSNAYPETSNNPKSIYGYQTHNLYKDYPPMMNDGRVLVASWQPESITNDNLVKTIGTTSNWKYREFLTHAANEIRQQNYAETMNDIGYVARYANAPAGSYTPPYTYKSYLDNTTPTGYESSDLKELYLSREELSARKVSPVITQDELISRSKDVYNK